MTRSLLLRSAVLLSVAGMFAQAGMTLAQGTGPAAAPSASALPTTIAPVVLAPVEPVAAQDVFPDPAPPRTELQGPAGTPGPAPVGGGTVPSGIELTFDVGAGLRSDEDGLALRNTLNFGFTSRTREQLLTLNLGTAIDIDEDGVDTEDTFPDVDLSYVRDTGVLLLSLSASYAVSEIDGRIPDADVEFDETDLIRDTGTRETTALAFGFETGRRDPIGLEGGVSYRERTFRGTSDTDLTDTRTRRMFGAVRLTPAPTLTFRLTGARTETEDGGVIDSRESTRSYGGQVVWQATPITDLDFTLARTRVETTRDTVLNGVVTDQSETEVEKGLESVLSLTRARPNGTVGVRLGRTLTSNGTIDRLSASRALTLARGGEVSLSLGAVRFEGSSSFATINARYTQPLARGQTISASVQRDGFIDNDDQNVLRTRATLGYGRPLSPLSDLSVSVGLAAIEVVDGIDPDAVGGTLNLGYRRTLDRDWTLAAGYEGSYSREDGADGDSDSTVFVNISRRFTFRP